MEKLKKLRTMSLDKTGVKGVKVRVARAPKVGGLSDLARLQKQEADLRARAKQNNSSFEKTTDDRNFIEKGLNLKQDQGFFGDVFEVLGRPMQAAEGFMQTKGNPFENAFKGFTGQKRYSGSQLLNDYGITSKNTPRWLSTLAGFGVDMALDPLAYTNAPFR